MKSSSPPRRPVDDDITTKITAIQQATAGDGRSHGSISATVRRGSDQRSRVRQAMELQAQTVTMITAAVDENRALAAYSMSSTHRRDPQETEQVARPSTASSRASANSPTKSPTPRKTKEFVAHLAA